MAVSPILGHGWWGVWFGSAGGRPAGSAGGTCKGVSEKRSRPGRVRGTLTGIRDGHDRVPRDGSRDMNVTVR
jgi:hypothetical protein